jgi:type III secretory pathway component EscU
LKAKDPKRSEMVSLIEQYRIKLLEANELAETLADKYVSEEIIP